MIHEAVFMREVEAIERTLYRICRTLLHSEADCCDAVQTALLKAWQHRETIQEDRFRAYLTRILINECHNIGRKRARMTVVEQIPERIDERQTDSLDIRDALMHLSETHRLVLVMHYLEGFSLSEIARALRVPLGTVKYRIVRARKALRKQWTLDMEEGGAHL